MKPVLTVLILTALTIGGLSLSENTAEAAVAGPQVSLLSADVVAQPGCNSYMVMYKMHCGPWQCAGTFNCLQQAQATANFLRLLGNQVYIRGC